MSKLKTGYTTYHGKRVKYIDMTPTWKQALSWILPVIKKPRS